MKQSKKSAKKVAKKTQSGIVKKKNLSLATPDELPEQNFEDEVEDSDENEEIGEKNEENDSDDSDVDPVKHKKSLVKLKETDPEFYSYLKQNDSKLLNFDLSDDDGTSADEDESKHIPDYNLEVGSDESDYELEENRKDDASGRPIKVTLQLLKTWQSDLESDRSSKTIKCVMEAFHAALETVTSDRTKNKGLQYRVEGGAVFNGVVQLCVLQLPAALKRFLNLGSETRFEVHKAKKFVKIKGALKSYLADLIKILKNVTSSSVLVVLLKHLHQMLPYTQSFSSLSKPLLRILLKFWSSGEEVVRVVAFLSILRFATGRRESVLETLLKTMYVKYVENAKFVSPNTLPGINFMRHSLTEIYLLDSNLSYNHAFLYIRQLAIHLRNAMTLKKKENFQAVYNWQYVNSLRFWAELITLSKNQSMLRSLLYPLIQIITGTIKLIPTAQYYPLRFHCTQMLINISRDTNTFVPILPFVLEILNSYDFNKKHKSVSMKPMSLMCLLRMSKSQLQENGFKDSVIETIYQLILETAAKDSHTIYFPDLYVPCVMQLKAFLKSCHVANYCRKIKQLAEKIEENRKFIETERARIIVDLKDMTAIQSWENRVKSQGTPLAKFYDSWIKIHNSLKLKSITRNDEIAEYRLPAIRKSKKRRTDDDYEGNSDLDMPVELIDGMPKKAKKGKAKRTKRVARDVELPTDDNDIVKDMSIDEWD